MPNEKKWREKKHDKQTKQIWIYSAMAKILDDGVLIIMGGVCMSN